MFKLVVLLSAAALAAAQPGLLAPGLLGAGLYGHGLGLHGLGVHGLGVHGLGLHGLGAPGLLAHGGLYGHGLAAPYHGLGAPTIYAPHGGSLPHGQPANIIGADGRPLDTIDVNVDRARHLTARIVDASHHHLLKRSLALPYAAAVSHTSRIDFPGHAYGYAAPLGIGHLGVGPWGGLGHGHWGGLGHLGFAGPLGAHW